MIDRTLTFENLQVSIYDQTVEMGEAAALFVQKKIASAIQEKGHAHMILATGASQFSFLTALQNLEIEWQKISVFHLDEYKGMPDTHPASFRKYLKERILNAVKPKEIFFLNADADDMEEELIRYSDELKKHPIDIACIGIGENGHIAFNDPPVADFNDPKLVKLVTLDEPCRKQQFGEGWFPTLDDVPTEAFTLTIPAIINSKAISCVVPDDRKSEAVYNTLNGEISTKCPASILRTHPDAILFLDKRSASKLA